MSEFAENEAELDAEMDLDLAGELDRSFDLAPTQIDTEHNFTSDLAQNSDIAAAPSDVITSEADAIEYIARLYLKAKTKAMLSMVNKCLNQFISALAQEAANNRPNVSFEHDAELNNDGNNENNMDVDLATSRDAVNYSPSNGGDPNPVALGDDDANDYSLLQAASLFANLSAQSDSDEEEENEDVFKIVSPNSRPNSKKRKRTPANSLSSSGRLDPAQIMDTTSRRSRSRDPKLASSLDSLTNPANPRKKAKVTLAKRSSTKKKRPSSLVWHPEEQSEAPDDEDSDGPRRAKTNRALRNQEDNHDQWCTRCMDGGTLILCQICPAAWHLECLDPPLTTVPRGKWYCPECSPHMGVPIPFTKILCYRWEPTTEGPSSRLMWHVKLRGRSYLHTKWVTNEDLEALAAQLLKTWLRKHGAPAEPPPTPSASSSSGDRQKKRGRSQATLSAVPDDDTDTDEEEPNAPHVDGVNPEWRQIDRILFTRVNREFVPGESHPMDDIFVLVKWKSLEYTESTWELPSVFSDQRELKKALENYNNICSFEKRTEEDLQYASNRPSHFALLREQPPGVSGGRLYEYQLEGINWLRQAWHGDENQKSQSVILADEMGLGKTIQTIGFLSSLISEGYSRGPFLLIAPSTTLYNWAREFESWAPHLYTVLYRGSIASRELIRQYEFHFQDDEGSHILVGSNPVTKFHVLITSYEMALVDNQYLRPIDWQVMVVDEAHRLKDRESKLYKEIVGLSTSQRVLLTGTPLQNNIQELFNLLEFMNPDNPELPQIRKDFAEINEADQLARLREILKPLFLRRLKKDVLKQLPPKKEAVVGVDMTPLQQHYYRAVLTKNYDALRGVNRLGERTNATKSLSNVFFELKKCVNHPFLFPGAEPPSSSPANELLALIKACGKMQVLDQMLTKLKEAGHRVLIFSQSLDLLDILEDYVVLKGWKFGRIDGSVDSRDRETQIDAFNAPNSPYFVFLLSTRAGGTGINLASADTVFIYDSDWNPHQDLQALSRSHRIGQRQTVMIYRFVTRKSIEESIILRSKQKLALEHLVFNKLNKRTGVVRAEKELHEVLRWGAAELFEKDSTESSGPPDPLAPGPSITYSEDDLSKLLDRTQAGALVTDVADEDDLFDSFKVAQFSVQARTAPEPAPASDIAEDPTLFWQRLLQSHSKSTVQEDVLDDGRVRLRNRNNAARAIAMPEVEEDNNESVYEPPDGGDAEDADDADEFVMNIRSSDDSTPKPRRQRRPSHVGVAPDSAPNRQSAIVSADTVARLQNRQGLKVTFVRPAALTQQRPSPPSSSLLLASRAQAAGKSRTKNAAGSSNIHADFVQPIDPLYVTPALAALQPNIVHEMTITGVVPQGSKLWQLGLRTLKQLMACLAATQSQKPLLFDDKYTDELGVVANENGWQAFSRMDRSALEGNMMKFGLALNAQMSPSWAPWKNVIRSTKGTVLAQKKPQSLQTYGNFVLADLNSRESIHSPEAERVFVGVGTIHLIRQKLKLPNFSMLDASLHADWEKYSWKAAHDKLLLMGVLHYGSGSWPDILKDEHFVSRAALEAFMLETGVVGSSEPGTPRFSDVQLSSFLRKRYMRLEASILAEQMYLNSKGIPATQVVVVPPTREAAPANQAVAAPVEQPAPQASQHSDSSASSPLQPVELPEQAATIAVMPLPTDQNIIPEQASEPPAPSIPDHNEIHMDIDINEDQEAPSVEVAHNDAMEGVENTGPVESAQEETLQSVAPDGTQAISNEFSCVVIRVPSNGTLASHESSHRLPEVRVVVPSHPELNSQP